MIPTTLNGSIKPTLETLPVDSSTWRRGRLNGLVRLPARHAGGPRQLYDRARRQSRALSGGNQGGVVKGGNLSRRGRDAADHDCEFAARLAYGGGEL